MQIMRQASQSQISEEEACIQHFMRRSKNLGQRWIVAMPSPNKLNLGGD